MKVEVNHVFRGTVLPVETRPLAPRAQALFQTRLEVPVLHTVSAHRNGRAFNTGDLRLLEVVALFVGKTIQAVQLQNILNSRFAQLALVEAAEKDIGRALASTLPNPDQVARIVAKSFFKEMSRAGFGSRQIINAASEIISQLSSSLRRHSQRIDRESPELPREATARTAAATKAAN